MSALKEPIPAPEAHAAQEGAAAAGVPSVSSTPVSTALLPYQVRWITDKSPLRLWEKSRRIGASYTLALEAVLSGMETGGSNTYYLSYNKDMTRQFIKDAAYWCRRLEVSARQLEEQIITNDKKDITVYRIVFASGAEIAALPSVEYSLRSKQGDVILDEAAFVDDFEGVKKAALALLIWGGRFSILSTHNGEDNPFHLFIKKIRSGTEKDWTLHRTTFDQAVEQGLYRKICEVQKRVWTREGERAFCASIYDIYKDNADEELRCIPLKAGMRYFPRLLLERCAGEASVIVRERFADSFVHEKKGKKEAAIKKLFAHQIRPTLQGITGAAYFGFDFARSGDLSVLWLCEKKEETLESRLILELRNCPFDEQYQLLTLIIAEVATLVQGKCDARGNGQMLAEKLSLAFPGICEQVMISAGWYARVMPQVKNMLEEKSCTIPSDEYLFADFSVVQLVNGIPKIGGRTSEGYTGSARHGDGAVAFALCVDALLEDGEAAAPYGAETHPIDASMFRGY